MSLFSRSSPPPPPRSGDLSHPWCWWALTRVMLDAGGGGKQIADRLHELRHYVRAINFGESPSDKQAYKNRRAELYGELRVCFNGDRNEGAFGLPPCNLLREELGVLPRQYDSEGKLFLPPKERRGAGGPSSLRELLGRSPDRADSLVLAVWGLDAGPAPGIIEGELLCYAPGDDVDLTPEEWATCSPFLREIMESCDDRSWDDD